MRGNGKELYCFFAVFSRSRGSRDLLNRTVVVKIGIAWRVHAFSPLWVAAPPTEGLFYAVISALGSVSQSPSWP